MDPTARSRLENALCLTFLLFATIVLTWPLSLHLDTRLPGHLAHPGLQGDLFFQWNLHRQMQDGHLDHVWTPYVCYPVGQELRAKVAFSLHLAVYVVFMLFCNLLRAHNLTVLLILFLNAAAAWALIRERFGTTAFALGSALLFAFGPFVYLKLDQGFVQKVTLFHLPLFVLFFLRVLEGGRLRDAAWCAVFLVLSLLVYPPFGVFNLALALVLLAGAVVTGSASRSLARPLAVVGAAVLPIFLLVWLVGRDDFLLADRMSLTLKSFHSEGGYLDLFHAFRFFPYLGTFPGKPHQHFVESLPLGVPVLPLALAVVGVLGRRRYAGRLLLFAGVLVLLMAGPYLTRAGEPVLVGGRPVALPFLLADTLPFSHVLRFPIRLFPWLVLALLLAAGEGLRWLAAQPRLARWARALPVVAGVLLVAEPHLLFPQYGLFLVEEPRPPLYCRHGLPQGSAAVLHLPYYPPGLHEYLYQAVVCDTPIVNPATHLPPPFAIPAPDAGPAEKTHFVRCLRAYQIRTVVVHPDNYLFYEQEPGAEEPSLGPRPRRFTGADVEAWLEQYLGPPRSYPEDGVRVYGVGSDLAAAGAQELHAQELVTAEQDAPQLGHAAE